MVLSSVFLGPISQVEFSSQTNLRVDVGLFIPRGWVVGNKTHLLCLFHSYVVGHCEFPFVIRYQGVGLGFSFTFMFVWLCTCVCMDKSLHSDIL